MNALTNQWFYFDPVLKVTKYTFHNTDILFFNFFFFIRISIMQLLVKALKFRIVFYTIIKRMNNIMK